MAGRRHRPAVLVDPDHGGIDGEAGEAEIVEVAAKGGGAVLGREGEAHVGVTAIVVEPELAAAIEGDDLAAPRLVTAAGLALDPPRFGVAGLGEGLAREAGPGALHALGHVADRDQYFGGHARAGAFVGALAGVKPVS